jgi:hypothetical protein
MRISRVAQAMRGGSPPMSAVSLIVMEPGSEWPGHFGGCGEVVAIGHDDDGLARRTRQEIAKVQARGHHVRVAVLACNEAFDSEARLRRAEVVDELLGALKLTRFGRLLLSARQRAPLSFRCDMLLLAATLTDALRERSASVSVRFGDAQALPAEAGFGESTLAKSALRILGPTGLRKTRFRREA